MRKLFYLILLAAILLIPFRASFAQDETRVGVGVGFTSGFFGGSGLDFVESFFSPANIYVPITFGSFRIEPQIGIVRASSEEGDNESSQTLLELGTGLFGLQDVNSTTIYYGGRIGITRASSSTDTPGGEFETSSTNVFLGPAAGAEHFFGESFSLGGEAQLMYTSIGDDDEEDDDSSASVIRTRALFFVRLHF